MCRHDDNWSDSHLDQSTVKEQLNRPIQSINWTIVMRESWLDRSNGTGQKLSPLALSPSHVSRALLTALALALTPTVKMLIQNLAHLISTTSFKFRFRLKATKRLSINDVRCSQFSSEFAPPPSIIHICIWHWSTLWIYCIKFMQRFLLHLL